jgi:hypothetical protein
MRTETRRLLSRTHRLLGLAATIPLVGWVASSFVLHGVGLALPNGLQGTYELHARTEGPVSLENADLRTPSEILGTLRAEGTRRVYWLRLEHVGGVPAYVVKPGPYALERVYDARSGERLDPLPDEMLRRIANEELAGTRGGDRVGRRVQPLLHHGPRARREGDHGG